MLKSPDDFDWNEFFTRYRPMALRFTTGRIHDAGMAEDLFQEGAQALFERFQEDPSLFQNAAHLRNYLFKTLNNMAVSALREKARRKALSLDHPDTCTRNFATWVSPSPHDSLLPGIEKNDAKIRQIMASLKNHERESLRLRFEEGLSFQEMASRTGRPISTLHSRVENALKKIRKKIGNEPQNA
ncbi:MAG: sigma-70 family RNA polymerase sigma factor [Planctomycetota bacterium]